MGVASRTLVGLLAIGMLVACEPGAAGGPAGTAGQPTPTEAAQSGPIKAKLGTPVTIEGIEVTIKAMQWSAGGEFLKPAKGYVWVAYDIQLKSLDGNKYVSSSDWSVAADGTKQGKWTIATVEDWEPLLSLEEVREGATTSGWVVFEVPKPAKYVRLTYDPSFFSDEAQLTLDANCCK